MNSKIAPAATRFNTTITNVAESRETKGAQMSIRTKLIAPIPNNIRIVWIESHVSRHTRSGIRLAIKSAYCWQTHICSAQKRSTPWAHLRIPSSVTIMIICTNREHMPPLSMGVSTFFEQRSKRRTVRPQFVIAILAGIAFALDMGVLYLSLGEA